MIRRLFILALVVSIALPLAGKDDPKTDDSLPLTFQKVVSDFLSGETNPGIIAYVSNGEFHESIPDKAELKKTYGACRMSFMKVLVVDDRGMAVVNLKTVLASGETQWHTFVCKSSDAKWSVVTWHSGRA